MRCQVPLVDFSQNVTSQFMTTCSHLQLDLGILQLQDQIATILVIFTTMIQLLEKNHPIGWIDFTFIFIR